MSFPGYYFFVREDLMIHKQNISLLKVLAAEHKDDVIMSFIFFLSLCNINVCLLIVFARNVDSTKINSVRKKSRTSVHYKKSHRDCASSK